MHENHNNAEARDQPAKNSLNDGVRRWFEGTSYLHIRRPRTGKPRCRTAREDQFIMSQCSEIDTKLKLRCYNSSSSIEQTSYWMDPKKKACWKELEFLQTSCWLKLEIHLERWSENELTRGIFTDESCSACLIMIGGECIGDSPPILTLRDLKQADIDGANIIFFRFYRSCFLYLALILIV